MPNRPTTMPGQINRPENRPTTLPGQINRPENRPAPLPGQVNRPENRPVTLPGTLPGRPTTRPSLPDLGGTTRPNLPGGGTNRPNLPGDGQNRPNLPGVGQTRPNLPGGPTTRPNLPGANTRPNPGDLGDFLGMDRPVTTLPGVVGPGTRPNLPDISNRPGLGNDRPGINRPGNNRPGNDRPGVVNRPIDIGNINIGNNTVINNRPSWVNIDRGRYNQINNRWQGQINGLHGWNTRYPNRMGYWNGWANGVRFNPRWNSNFHGCFRPNWWGVHPYPWGGWHYGWCFGRHNWNYWWTVPTFVGVTNWFRWTAPPAVWAQPVYYDYGQGGNVVYNDNSVYINGEQISTADEFAQSAADLATVPPPPSPEEAKEEDWMSLGTFAVSRGEKDQEPTMIAQLAVNKDGVVSGTLFDTSSDKSQTIQGQVDKSTQRVAVRVGESEDLVVETGLYNLTQEEAPVLVHFGAQKVENWLLVRMEAPAEDDTDQ
ncbi:MAG: mu-protocadherin- cell-suface protein [Planctomycetota bacterium]|nr:MAG: mu-protocadherin- cell-suface protein [Planctomycetota bacterium]